MSSAEEEHFYLRTWTEQGCKGILGRGKCKCKGPRVGRNKVGSRNPERACGAGVY